VQHSLAGEEACCLHVFFPYLADLQVDKVEDLGNGVLITARSRAGTRPVMGADCLPPGSAAGTGGGSMTWRRVAGR
jgi:hypothetical protein